MLPDLVLEPPVHVIHSHFSLPPVKHPDSATRPALALRVRRKKPRSISRLGKAVFASFSPLRLNSVRCRRRFASRQPADLSCLGYAPPRSDPGRRPAAGAAAQSRSVIGPEQAV